ncbi:MAG: protein-L-isoaspartate(D-aspartate) O-methyltransferase [Desulfovibrio sp.]|nr:protein-L-isoaspartate(D-aspartate) O-methyltransferase [Desulfovibrio sp.]
MVREQIMARGITDENIINAMLAVPRHLFVPEAFRARAYADTPLPIGFGQTISQPYVVAVMTAALEVEPGARTLEVGAGSGYQAAILAAMGCVALGIERSPELYRQTLARVRSLGLSSKIHLYRGDGTLGLPNAAPYERILVSAGAPSIPAPLLRQLAEGGVMVVPVGEKRRKQRLIRTRKIRGKYISEDLGAAEFVDLVGDYGWQSES